MGGAVDNVHVQKYMFELLSANSAAIWRGLPPGIVTHNRTVT